ARTARRFVAHVALDQREACPPFGAHEPFQGLAPRRREVVEHAPAPSGAQQRFDEVRTAEARPPRDQPPLRLRDHGSLRRRRGRRGHDPFYHPRTACRHARSASAPSTTPWATANSNNVSTMPDKPAHITPR